jgi:SAM-dependent methyltransferase
MSLLRQFVPDSHRVAYWTASDTAAWPQTGEMLAALQSRWARYAAGGVDMQVAPADDMLVDTPDGREHYRLVGLSGLNLVVEAMLLSGRTAFGSVLDLPCGGGRITRHLVRFLDDAEVFVDDIDAAKKAAVLAQFPVQDFTAPRNFRGSPARQFDLILVGSLLTHLDEPTFRRALDYLVAALTPGGILIVSLHGRCAATTMRRPPATGPSRWPSWAEPLRARLRERRPVRNFLGAGFGYVESRDYTRTYGQSYGGTFTSPAWIMRLIERRPDVALLGFRERAFATHQDVLMLQKLSV